MSEDQEQRYLLWWRVLAFTGVTALFFYALFAATMPKYAEVSTLQEVANADLSQEYVCLSPAIADAYPGRLYEPADFAEGEPAAGDADAKYQTYRIVLRLKPGITYGISGETATYAQRVYVNGELLSKVGRVSDSPSGFTPKTDAYEIFFTPATDETEIIVQHAWLNHAHGAFHKVYLAEQQVITKLNRSQTICDGIIVGSLLAIAVFFFGMFLFNLSRRGMLWFSLSGLCAAANYLIYESKQIMVFFPDLNWYVGHKVELLTNIYYFLFVALFAFATLGERLPRWLKAVSLVAVGAPTVFYLFAPSTLYSYYTVPIGAFALAYELLVSATLLYVSVKKGRMRLLDKALVALAPLFAFAVYLVEGITYFGRVFYLRAYLMVLFAFCYALVSAVEHTRTERSLSEAQQRELEIAEENVTLEKMNRLKSDFMRNLAHEMKTPLTVMSGYAQLTERQIKKDVVDEETVDNLETIAREAGRLSDMVTQLLDVTYQRAESREASVLEPLDLMRDAAAVCRPILLKNENRLEFSCEARRAVVANKEALLQVLINLIINSNKHTTRGVVSLGAHDREDGMVAFAVTDTGSGISAEDMPYVFERGYSKDGSSGLGLTICREIVEAVGGAISIDSADAEGASICFTVPAEKEDK